MKYWLFFVSRNLNQNLRNHWGFSGSFSRRLEIFWMFDIIILINECLSVQVMKALRQIYLKYWNVHWYVRPQRILIRKRWDYIQLRGKIYPESIRLSKGVGRVNSFNLPAFNDGNFKTCVVYTPLITPYTILLCIKKFSGQFRKFSYFL